MAATNSLKKVQRGLEPISVQLSEGDAVLDSTATDSEKLVVLGAILQGLIENVMSQDVIMLSVYRAQSICDRMGMDSDIFFETVQEFLGVADKARKRNPMHSMF